MARKGKKSNCVRGVPARLTGQSRHRQGTGELAQHGRALLQRGKVAEAIDALRQALQLAPENGALHKDLAEALWRSGRPGQALIHGEEALRLKPGFAEGHNLLGVVLQELGQIEKAVGHFREAIRLAPDNPGSYNNLGILLQNQGDLDAAVAHFRKAVKLAPHDTLNHSNLLFALNYHPGIDRGEVFAEQRAWAARHAAPLASAIRPHPNDPDPERPLRIGYVSPDFRFHPVMFFLEPILAGYDREAFEVFCYASQPRADQVTKALQRLPHAWRDIYGMTDAQAAELIRQDGIDILVDLAGHTAENRLLLFARKPAPLQITYLGNPDGTGLDTIDLRITDPWCDPPGMTEHLHSEELIRLPGHFFCYQPPEVAPEVSPLPARTKGYVTFGSFNNFSKVSAELQRLWAEILGRVPNSRLLLQSKALGESRARRQLLDFFAPFGIAEERIRTLGRTSFLEHLALFHEVDLALDTFPWNGHTTTCHTLWMGVPVITTAGRHCAARMGVSVLSGLGLQELIAATPEKYAASAAQLAGDLDRLENLRQGMRARLAASPLTDAAAFNRTLEGSYRQIWRRWCEQSASRAAERED